MCSSTPLGGGAYRCQRREEQARNSALPGTGCSPTDCHLEEGNWYGFSEKEIIGDRASDEMGPD